MALRSAVHRMGSLHPIVSMTRIRKISRCIHISAQASSSESQLSKAELVEIVAVKAGLSKENARSAIDAFTDTIINAVSRDQKVSIFGFGSFERTVRAARKGRNPATNQEIDIPAKAAPVFRAGKAFKDSVANSTP